MTKSRSTSLLEYPSRRIMFSLTKERFEQTAAKLAASDGKIDHDMLDADEMAAIKTHDPATT